MSIPMPNPTELQALTQQGFSNQLKTIAERMRDAAADGYYRSGPIALESSQAWLFEHAGFVVTPVINLNIMPSSAYTQAVDYHISWDPEAIRQRQADTAAQTPTKAAALPEPIVLHDQDYNLADDLAAAID
ncbi:MAG: hypothetical protein NVS3B25_25060 [Hymenobacter sp.]